MAYSGRKWEAGRCFVDEEEEGEEDLESFDFKSLKLINCL